MMIMLWFCWHVTSPYVIIHSLWQISHTAYLIFMVHGACMQIADKMLVYVQAHCTHPR